MWKNEAVTSPSQMKSFDPVHFFQPRRDYPITGASLEPVDYNTSPREPLRYFTLRRSHGGTWMLLLSEYCFTSNNITTIHWLVIADMMCVNEESAGWL